MKNHHTLFTVISGSKAYGTDDENSDTDIREVVLNTTEELLGLHNFETSVKEKEEDIVIHSAKKYFNLLIKGNFNVHEWLWVPEDCVLHASDKWYKLLQLCKSKFLHDGIGKSILGYLNAQIKLMQRGRGSTRDLGKKRKALIEKYGYDTKAAYHAYRLAITGKIMYETGVLTPRLQNMYIDMMMKFKRGEFSFEEAIAYIKQAVSLMENAREKNTADIRKKPDTKFMNSILIYMNLNNLKEEY